MPNPSDATGHYDTSPRSDETFGSTDRMADTIARRIGDYELLEELARGGMGIVFRARQVSLNRVVAVKMILAGTYASPDAVRRFRAEAEAVATLDHPNILPIHEVGEADGHQFFSMKLVEGGSLSASMDDLRDDPHAAAELMQTLARAVHFAHQRGILHRDLKPGNVLLDTDGTPYLTDFGLAKKIDSNDGASRTGAVVGTPSYMSPEQASGAVWITTAVDIYSLGAMLYEMLTGNQPFRGETVYETVRQVIEREPRSPRDANPKADPDLSAIALKCLEKDPARRYASAAELADDFGRWLDGEPTIARPPTFAGLALRWLRRNLAAAIGVVVLGIAWGLSVTASLFAAGLSEDTLLVPHGAGLLNPIRLIDAVEKNPAVRYGVLALAATLTVGIGWWIRAVAGAKTTGAAFAAAGVVGVLATLTSFSILGSGAAAEFAGRGMNRLHAVTEGDPSASRQAPEDLAYLRDYLPRDFETRTRDRQQTELRMLHIKALNTNRLYAGIVIGWMVLGFVAGFFLSLALFNAWSANYLARSRPWLPARAWCYFEWYLIALAWLSQLYLAAMMWLSYESQVASGGPPWWRWLIQVLALTVLFALAIRGVVRLWPPALRFAIYIAIGGIFYETMRLLGR